MEQLLRKCKKYQGFLCGGLCLLALLLLGWAVYGYHQWQSWHTMNGNSMERVHQISYRDDRSEILRRWQGRDRNVMDVVQDEGKRWGIVVLSLTGIQGAKSYEAECHGEFRAILEFLNGMERYDPPLVAELIDMKTGDDGISIATIRILADT
ncbi:MAG: hypothetical protein LKF47_04570 [Megasphaera sp.]|nr:hypothetical protein [Megasphaera sp.]MCI1248115.1 hypothetical protein [Megasphaera sp.]